MVATNITFDTLSYSNELKKKDFGSTLWFMNMRNRFGWNNNQDLDENKVTKHEDALKELE